MLAISRSKKSGNEGSSRLVLLNQNLLVKLKRKKQMHKQLKQGQVTWEEMEYECVRKAEV